jgi:glucitol operon activator protein
MKEIVIIVVFMMLLQFATGIWHIKYYQSVVRKMGRKYEEGYLGVGMNQRKLKSGQVCIIVADRNGDISECRILSGLTVFSLFRKDTKYIGENIYQIDWNGKEKYRDVVENAIQMIKKEMQKGKTNSEAVGFI